MGINGTLPAPSWSWAAVAGPVAFDKSVRYTADVYAECLQATTTNQFLNSAFSTATTGLVKLYGLLLPIKLWAYGESEPNGASIDGHNYFNVGVWMDRVMSVEDFVFFMLPICCSTYRFVAPDLDYLAALLITRNVDGSFSRRGILRAFGKWEPLVEGSKQVIDLV